MPNTREPALPSIPGYTLTEQLYLGRRTAVYRAVSKGALVALHPEDSHPEDSHSVVIKVLRSPHPNFSELVRFRNQYTVTKHLSIDQIVKPLALIPWQHRYALVMEDVGGSVALSAYLQKQGSLSVDQGLIVALQLATILHQLSQQQVVHKDIKPANILIQPDTLKIWLIDFSLASLLPKETQTTVPPNDLEGTLAYIAPEQTGRMNRGIDYRVDFYGLGVTLYEAFTGHLPFASSDDPLELIHCHLTQQPVPLHEVNLPPPLSDIVLKLMAKNAEDRYQSALGLKHDLQYCLSQWQETGEIAPFELGLEDRCDRFLIPEKLYGRETEVQTLLNAFERASQGASELMLVAGFSGIGKTAVINEVHKPITRQKGYFIQGKFDQLNRNIPLSAFVQAFRDLARQLLSEDDTALQVWKTRILAALGDNAQVIIDLIPELKSITGPQPSVPELAGTAAQNRFNLLFQRFIQVFTTTEHPLVIFVDDLQWADSVSLNLIQRLMAETQTGHLLLLGAYRDNEVFPAHPLMLTLANVAQIGATIQTITLQTLGFDSLNQLISDILHAPEPIVQPLTELVIQKTQGNPFFATQFLQALHQDQCITFDDSAGHWQCDMVQVKEIALTDDVKAFMVKQLRKLPSASQNMLKLAACIGAEFDLETLAIISEQSQTDIATQLWPALQAGLILPQSEMYKFHLGEVSPPTQGTNETEITPSYRFLHDRVQHAAYSLIAEGQQQHTHLKMGQLLLQHSCQQEQQEQQKRLFKIVNHLNIGISLLAHQDREQLADLNLAAGQKARAATAYGAAITYFSTGISLLPDSAWERHYGLALALHNAITDASYLNTDFEAVEQWAEVVLQQAHTLTDTIKVQQTRMMSAKSQGQFLVAITLGLEVLQSMGFSLPAQPTQADIDQTLASTQTLWAGQTPQRLLALSPMEDAQSLAAMEILTTLVSSAYIAAPKLMPLLICKQVELSIKRGNSPVSIYAYADYGLIVSNMVGDRINGYEFGELALSLLEKLQAKPFKSRCLNVVYTFVKHWKTSLSEVLPGLQAGYQSGLETGDIESVGYNASSYCGSAYYAGQRLADLAETMAAYRQVIDQHKQAFSLQLHSIYQQAVLNLLGHNDIPYQLTGDVFDQDLCLPELKRNNQRSALFSWHTNQMLLFYLFEQKSQAIQCAAETARCLDGGFGLFEGTRYTLYSALIQLSQFTDATAPERQTILHQVQHYQAQLKDWATLAPMNHQHCWELVEAERCRVIKQPYVAGDFYDRAIANAKHYGFIQEEALANELASKFYLAWGKEKVAAGYMQEAYYGYACWGANAKINDLERRYPTLLQPILQSSSARFNPLETLNVLGKTTVHQHSTSTSRQSSDTYNNELDFTAILRAAKALTTTVHLDELLQNLGQIILQQSGADRLILVLPRDPELSQHQLTWVIALVATPKSHYLGDAPLASQADIPVQLIQYVKNTQAVLFADTVDTTLPVVDHYLLSTRPQSFLCSPLFHHDQMTGILYLQSTTTAHLIAPNRLTSLNFLFSQAAIALHNAQLYESAALKSRIIEASVNGIAILEDGRYVYLNQRHLDLFGYARSELLGQSWERLYGPEQVRWFYDTACPLVEQQGQWSGETVARRKDGSIFEEEVSLFRLADGKLICICRDISERVQLEVQRQQTETELQQSLVQLQASNQELEAFAYSIAHDLRTPLRAINGYSHTLMEDYGDRLDEMGHRYFERICTNTNRMADLIDDLLHLAQVSRLDLKCEPVNLTALAHTLLAELQAAQPERSVDITIEADLVAMADPALIKVVMQNLLENAWKFSCDRTPAHIEVGILSQDSLIPFKPPLPAPPPQDISSPIYFVRDNGVGFDMAYADKLFGIFQRLHGMDEFPGTGIGLVIAKRAIQRHGGRIWATAKVNQGATFYFTLPGPQPGRH